MKGPQGRYRTDYAAPRRERGPYTCPVKGEIVNIFGFVGHMICYKYSGVLLETKSNHGQCVNE